MTDPSRDDPMPDYPPSRPGHRWVRTEMGWGTERIPKTTGATPHALLKKACLLSLKPWRDRTGGDTLLLPSMVGQITVDDGTRSGRKISIGRKGQSDHLIIVGANRVLWGVVLPEYKAGRDEQRHAQKVFQGKAEWVGALYVIVRQPSDLTDALDQIAAQRGKIF